MSPRDAGSWTGALIYNLTGSGELLSFHDAHVGVTNARYDKWAQAHPQAAAFVDYASFGLMDPKMPAEFRMLGPAYVVANVLGLGAALWFFDPLHKREGGVDDWWGAHSNQYGALELNWMNFNSVTWDEGLW